MQNLFNLETVSFEGTVLDPQWSYIKRGLKENLNKTISYYRNSALRVDGSHILIRLLYSIFIPKDMPDDVFYKYLMVKSLKQTSIIGLTSGLSKGKLFDGSFYGVDCPEIIIAHDTSFDYIAAAKGWESLSAITVLDHPKSDINLDLPIGNDTSDETGLVVVAINIPMLIFQYRKWLQYQRYLEITGHQKQPASMFIVKYVLTNMLASQLDVAIFNRAYNLLMGAPIGESKLTHPFYLVDYSERLNDSLKFTLNSFKTKKPKFNTLLKSLQMVSCDNLQQLSELPECVLTRQVIWGLVASRLKMISFMFRACDDDPRIRNGVEVNAIRRRIGYYNTDRALASSLPINLYLDAKTDIDAITFK